MDAATEAAGPDGIVVSFRDDDVPRWRIPPGHRLERFTLSDGNLKFVRFASGVPLDNKTPAWAERGLSLSLPLAFNNRTAGHTIEIGVIARRAAAAPAAFLSLAYATQQAGNSGWQKLGLSNAFEVSTFRYDVPVARGGYVHPPVIVLHSDPSGSGKAAELLVLYVKLAGAR